MMPIAGIQVKWGSIANHAPDLPLESMLASIPFFLRVPFVVLAIIASTVAHTTPLFLIALLKWLLPVAGIRRLADALLVRLVESWIAVNSGLVDRFTRTAFRISGGQGLLADGHYLVLSNHQSWVDIIVLQKVFNRRMPFLRFFLKRELIWVPFLGLAWWALDFPFMNRYSRKQLARHPELAGKDVEATRRACEKFKGMPVSIMNFVEGTRFTPQKRQRQSSPYAHLLKPKAGGVAFVMDAMGSALHSVVDATIVYPAGIPTLLDLISGRIPEVGVDIRERPIPAQLLQADYVGDSASRVLFQRWLTTLWLEKDAVVSAGAQAAKGPQGAPTQSPPG